ncbi:hypothetical protein ORJ04_12115 [Rheinheimera baltica]|uniref:Uncharacterized protein n=1 Tax=Rheinheimera baltica TaxID=67576 RepID=A0ABT9HZZ8_9GAMM|nr:hypothetical protein [Rheinheimera baltica]MDP5136693.1 hypothetical protein [Rheinheimera baltica]
MRSSKAIKRFLKKEYSPKKMLLPKSLEFLSDINFHAIVEDESSGRVIRTVEIKPATLKRLIEDVDILLDCIEDRDDLIKRLRADNRQLRSDNKKLIENHEYSRRLEFELKKSQDQFSDLSNQMQPSEILKSENKALLDVITKLESELSGLATERRELEKNLTLVLDENEKLQQVNATIRENESEELNLHRAKNSFFASDKRFKIYNTKPYRGS